MRDSLRCAVRFWYAQLLTLLGQKMRAADVFQRLVQEFPRHQRAWSALGFLRADRGQPEAAIAAFERAVALKSDPPALFNLGFVLQRSGRHGEAIERFQQTIALDRNLDRAWYGLGLSLAHEGRHEEAATKFQEAARLQPFNPYAGYHLAAAWFKLGQHDKVKAEYERVKGFDPKVAERIRLDFGVLQS